jgi:hypothetical protein
MKFINPLTTKSSLPSPVQAGLILGLSIDSSRTPN